jgi:uncharacterized protein YebE (UPF0316 family)
MNNLLITFIILNTLNVIIQTIKSILTIKGGKIVASCINALAYGFYTIVVIYMLCDLPIYQKALIVGICNLIGVYLVKFFEEKAQKEKLWKVEATVHTVCAVQLENEVSNVSHNKIDLGKHTLFTFYCSTKEESRQIKQVINQYGAKYFVSETKNL